MNLRKSTILVTCAKGIVPVLREEIIALSFPVLSEKPAGVETAGTFDDAMKLNLHIRSGQRVLYFLTEFAARDADELYAGLSQFPWEEYLYDDGYVSVASSVDNPTIRDPRYANLKGKDAIVDRINGQCGRRPNSGPDSDKAVIYFHWKGTHCRVYADTSGEPLSRRGYHVHPMDAPMQESLAAGVVLATGWRDDGFFVNPMCGSGTLAIEAALLAIGRAPGSFRTNYGFMHLKCFERPVWEAMREQARKTERKDAKYRIVATDINPAAIEAARKNAKRAGVDHLIDFSVCDYADTPIPEGGGVVVINPEYGRRQGIEKELKTVYWSIGNFLKRKCQGYTGFVFTGNLELAKNIGLRPGRRLLFYNGQIECRLIEFELFRRPAG